ncbi:MAG: hypothetical protein KGO02_15800 [Alphaproteobacteria bacterium]|nr:hypothetical protein [Alphaproteobacteria bacterium]
MRTGFGFLAVAALVEGSVLGLVHPVPVVRAATRTGSSASVRFQVSANVISHCEVAAPNSIEPALPQRAAMQQRVRASLDASCASGIAPTIAVRAQTADALRPDGDTTQSHAAVGGHTLAVLTITY